VVAPAGIERAEGRIALRVRIGEAASQTVQLPVRRSAQP